ncbi:unnamed protein product [Medioppia subpectinata]|uniref:MYND-type domain-containing protein n=1 Tax=Medioppia subpectinata TaxID=1979941 RepID=A0A7R9KMV5_9ACAR|nr:unnamed protein product [Medioppia subpectinata]CAG2106491.1 unnamed protein product [Medioppia subpectinata]
MIVHKLRDTLRTTLSYHKSIASNTRLCLTIGSNHTISEMSPKLSKPLSPGDVITEDMPIIHVLDFQLKDKYCDNCFKQSDQLKRCTKCLLTYYCGKECQKNDWKYHKNECPLYGHPMVQMFIDDNLARLWLRLYLSVKKVPNFATKKHRFFDGSDVSLNDIKVNGYDLDDSYKRELFKGIGILFEALRMDYEPKEVLHWLALVFTVPYVAIHSGDEQSIKFIGRALYALNIVLEHSCRPNSALITNFNGDLSIQLRAMRPIAAGEEITISLVSLGQNRADRHKELKQWSIDCECDKCVHHLDRRVDYRRLIPFEPLPLYVFSFGTQFMDYLRKVLTDLDVVYDGCHPQRTMFLKGLLMELQKCPLIPESVLNEMKANFTNEVAVTFRADDPFRPVLGPEGLVLFNAFVECKELVKCMVVISVLSVTYAMSIRELMKAGIMIIKGQNTTDWVTNAVDRPLSIMNGIWPPLMTYKEWEVDIDDNTSLILSILRSIYSIDTNCGQICQQKLASLGTRFQTCLEVLFRYWCSQSVIRQQFRAVITTLFITGINCEPTEHRPPIGSTTDNEVATVQAPVRVNH